MCFGPDLGRGRPVSRSADRRVRWYLRSSKEVGLAKLESMIKDSIARGARRQVRASVVPLRREVFRLRKKVASLQTTLGTLQRSAAAWERSLKGTPPVPKVS